MQQKRQRKCKHCHELYHPDHRVHHQKYCSAPACQKASKLASQARWLSNPKNRNYFLGKVNVLRTQAWRKKHPKYWRRRCPKRSNALQEMINRQPVDYKQDKRALFGDALQEMRLTQPSVVVGLISELTGSALQDEIVGALRKMQARGQAILGMVPGKATKGAGVP